MIVLAGVVAVLWAAHPNPAAGVASVFRPGTGGFTAFGRLAVKPGDGRVDNSNGSCVAPGYTDISPRTTLTVSAEGTVLSTGRVTADLVPSNVCAYTWAVPHVPTGLGLYEITLPGRGSVSLDEPAMHAQIQLVVAPPSGRLALAGVGPVGP